MAHLTQRDYQRIGGKLNRRQRNRLGLRTPEVGEAALHSALQFNVDFTRHATHARSLPPRRPDEYPPPPTRTVVMRRSRRPCETHCTLRPVPRRCRGRRLRCTLDE